MHPDLARNSAESALNRLGMWRPRQIHRMSPRRRCGRKSKSTRPSPCSAFRIVSSHLPPLQNGRRCVDPGEHRGRRLVKVAHFDPPLGIGWRSQRFFLLGASWSRWAAEEYLIARFGKEYASGTAAVTPVVKKSCGSLVGPAEKAPQQAGSLNERERCGLGCGAASEMEESRSSTRSWAGLRVEWRRA